MVSKFPHPKLSQANAGLESPPGPLVAPESVDDWSKLRAISLRCVHTAPQNYCQWHSHPFDELCLTTDGTTLNGFAGELETVQPNTLFHYRPGDQHGFWNDHRQRPRIWVVHFSLDPKLQAGLSAFDATSRSLRPCRLTLPQVETFKWLFMRMSVEHAQRESSCALAESAWLHLLLVNVHRWADQRFSTSIAPAKGRPEILQLWQAIQATAGRPAEFARRIRETPNYNSLRTEFTAVFGVSPSQMALRVRIQTAKSLLLETPLSIKEIAEQLGYVRQHEFTRMFCRVTGRPPTDWRKDPV